ncbi:MAG: D-alanyl-D-alanine carboxypeptidase family protein [Candidatus Paracaedibacter sp.]|jgi:D-alanyl-D-alanine carboxypeptidase
MSKLSLIICLIFFSYINQASCLPRSYTAIVIDARTGAVLEQDDADKLCHPASLTKMATLYMVFEALKTGRLRMNTQIPVSAHAARQAPSKLGLQAGEHVSVETIIKGLVTKSANDAAAAIAEYLGGSEANFAAQMTNKARSLGMRKTTFKNASGLPNPYQVTTARDMATLSRALYLHFPKDYQHFRMQAFHHQGKVHRNHNHLLGKVPGLDGIKTGWVAASGFNLAASAVRKGPDNKPTRLIAVVLGGVNRHWRDRRVSELLETNFQRVGLGNHLSVKVEDDEDQDDAEVTQFLKEEMGKQTIAKVAVRPIPVSWPSSSPKSSIPEATSQEEWGVQFGTYSSLNKAKLKARKMFTTIKTGTISTPRVKKGKKSFYGARLIGITRLEAEKACKKYAHKTKECRILALD